MSRPVGVEPEDETTSKVSVRYLSDADQAWLNWKLLNQENLPAPAVSHPRIRTIKPDPSAAEPEPEPAVPEAAGDPGAGAP